MDEDLSLWDLFAGEEVGHPIEQLTRVHIIARILHVPSAEVRDIPAYAIWDPPDGPGVYLWSDGNYGCDCNRHLYFTDWADDDVPCGEEVYRVNLVNPHTSRVYYREFSDALELSPHTS